MTDTYSPTLPGDPFELAEVKPVYFSVNDWRTPEAIVLDQQTRTLFPPIRVDVMENFGPEAGKWRKTYPPKYGWVRRENGEIEWTDDYRPGVEGQ